MGNIIDNPKAHVSHEHVLHNTEEKYGGLLDEIFESIKSAVDNCEMSVTVRTGVDGKTLLKLRYVLEEKYGYETWIDSDDTLIVSWGK